MEQLIAYGWNGLQILLIVSGLFCTVLGLITVVQWFKTPKAPSDDTNRINNIMSWWIGLTRPDILAHSYKAFQQDVMKNVDDVEQVKDN